MRGKETHTNCVGQITDEGVMTGTVERVTFHNTENGFCVLRVKAKGKRDLVTVVGHSIAILAGEFIEAQGVWINNKTHGLQFKATDLKTIQPDSIEGIEKYLGSGLIKGIGPGYAKRLIETFGVEVLEIIESKPERLKVLRGFGERRIQSILDGWREQKKIREIIIFLHRYGVGTAKAVRIYKTYGEKAIEKIKTNPYRLVEDIHGIGFKTADDLAIKLGLSQDAPVRVQAAVKYILHEFSHQGHCAVLTKNLVEEATNLLGIEPPMIHDAILHERDKGQIIEDAFLEQPGLFLANFYHAEKLIAEKMKALLQTPPIWPSINPAEAIAQIEKKSKISLSKTQQEAIQLAIASKVTIITGGPGVGKTTLVNCILQIIAQKTQKIMLCAPTGRAAKRLSESTGREALTIHRLLGMSSKGNGFQYNAETLLEADLLVIDETSMVDVLLMNHLLKAIPTHCAVLFVGDIDQLPSVGPGAVLFDLIRSNVIPCVRLTEIFRQAANSKIIVNAHRINNGQEPLTDINTATLSDFYFIPALSVDDIRIKLIKIISERIPIRFELDAVTDVQVLSPMNKGGLGTRSLNIELQKHLNIHAAPSVTRFGQTFCRGDKVIQTVNNYDKEIFNGDIGFITHIDEENSSLLIRFDDREIAYDMNELDEINLAYAITIHKSQGSEYPAVLIPLSTQHFSLLERNLIYTAVTRGKQLVIVIGQPQAMAMAIKKIRSKLRLTKLAERLQENIPILSEVFS